MTITWSGARSGGAFENGRPAFAAEPALAAGEDARRVRPQRVAVEVAHLRLGDDDRGAALVPDVGDPRRGAGLAARRQRTVHVDALRSVQHLGQIDRDAWVFDARSFGRVHRRRDDREGRQHVQVVLGGVAQLARVDRIGAGTEREVVEQHVRLGPLEVERRRVRRRVRSTDQWASCVLLRARPGALGDVLRGEVAEGDRRPDRRARPGVGVAHDRRAHVAGGVQAVDHRPVGAQHARTHVGAHAALRAEVAGHHRDGVERALVDRRQARIRLDGRVAVIAVVAAVAASVLLVLAGLSRSR